MAFQMCPALILRRMTSSIHLILQEEKGNPSTSHHLSLPSMHLPGPQVRCLKNIEMRRRKETWVLTSNLSLSLWRSWVHCLSWWRDWWENTLSGSRELGKEEMRLLQLLPEQIIHIIVQYYFARLNATNYLLISQINLNFYKNNFSILKLLAVQVIKCQ